MSWSGRELVSVFSLLATGALGCAHAANNGPVRAEGRDAEAFSAVTVRGLVDVQVTVGVAPKVEVRCAQALVPRVHTRVERGTLVVATDLPDDASTEGCMVVVKTPTLVALRTSSVGDVIVNGDAVGLATIESDGVGDVRIDSVRADSCTIKSSGVGDVAIGRLDATSVSVTATGTGDVKLAGRAARVSIVEEGTGEVDTRALAALRGDVEVTGTGEVHLHATEHADVKSSGVGDVHVSGQPSDRRAKTSGPGKVHWDR